MKKFITICLVLFVTLGAVFAEWHIGDYVDEFGDATGEHFICIFAEGEMSNSATNGAKSPLRIIVDVTGAVILEPHDYRWENPVEDFYSNSKATIKIKDEKGNAVTITKSNSVQSRDWNYMYGSDAVKLTELFSSNNSLKISIKIETHSYLYTVDCSGFKDAFNSLKFKDAFNTSLRKNM